jgi:putative Ca2+/H+ antiporter (TMEM165/GDT1 family)
LAVLLGSSFSKFLNRRVLSIAAGCGFILIGAWTLVGGIRNTG